MEVNIKSLIQYCFFSCLVLLPSLLAANELDTSYQNQAVLQLSSEEITYLNSHAVLRVQSENDYPPFNFIREGKPIGYSIDYVNLLAEILNIRIEFVTGRSWGEYLSMLERNELDFMVNIIRTDKREKFAVFTQPYTEITNFVITRDSSDQDTLLKRDTPKRIAIGEGYAINEDLKKKYQPPKLFT